MFGLSILTPRVILELVVAALIAGACWYAYHFVYTQGANSVQVLWDADKAAQAKQTEKLKDDAAKKTADLQSQADKQRSQSNAQIATLNTNLSAALDSLRVRASRSSESDMPGAARVGPTVSGTGATLFREDSEFLTREAARADRVLIDLRACQAAYNAAREALK